MDGPHAFPIAFIAGIRDASIVPFSASFRELNGAAYSTGYLHRIFSYIVWFNSYTDPVSICYAGHAVGDTSGFYFYVFIELLYCGSNRRREFITFKKGRV